MPDARQPSNPAVPSPQAVPGDLPSRVNGASLPPLPTPHYTGSGLSGGVVSSASEPHGPQAPSHHRHRRYSDEGLDRLAFAVAPILRRVPADQRADVWHEGVAGYLEAFCTGQEPAAAILSGVHAADRARRPPGTRSMTRCYPWDGDEETRREAEATSATIPKEWTAEEVLNELPEDLRPIADLVWIRNLGQEAAARELGVTRHTIRIGLGRAHRLLTDILRRQGVALAARGPTIRRKAGPGMTGTSETDQGRGR